MEQLSIFDYANDRKTDDRKKDIETLIHNENAFGCCSHYAECSAAKKCVISSEPHSEYCVYRVNLEKGLIFYGRNASAFDETKYSDMISIYNNLKPQEKSLFISILNVIIPGYLESIYMEHSDALEVLKEKRLLEVQIDETLLPEFNVNFLRKKLKTANPDVKLPRKKADLFAYIESTRPPEIYDDCIGKVRNVSISPNMLLYCIELRRSYISDSDGQKIKFSKYDIPGIKQAGKKKKEKKSGAQKSVG